MVFSTVATAATVAGFVLLAWGVGLFVRRASSIDVRLHVPWALPLALAGVALVLLLSLPPFAVNGFMQVRSVLQLLVALTSGWAFVQLRSVDAPPHAADDDAVGDDASASASDAADNVVNVVDSVVDKDDPVGANAVLAAVEPEVLADVQQAEAEGRLRHDLDAMQEWLVHLEDVHSQLQNDHEALRVQHQERLEQLELIAKELRTPLSLMQASTKILSEDEQLPEDTRRDIAYLSRNARVLLGCVDDLEAAAREDSWTTLRLSTLDFSGLVRRCSSHFSQLAAERACTFAIDCGQSAILPFDPRRMERVVLNLLFNAFKFTPRGGSIHVTTAPSYGEGVTLTVSDSGPGVPENARETVFNRAQPWPTTQVQRYGGAGLGLGQARQFVEQHHGRIECDESDAGGARFTVFLPGPCRRGGTFDDIPETSGARRIARIAAEELAEEADETRTIARMKRQQSTGAGVVLLVENDRETNRMVRHGLSDAYEVVWSHDGNDGLAKAEAVGPDVVIFAASLPGFAKDTFLQQLRSLDEHQNTPVLVLTTPDDDEQRIRLLRSGAQDFLAKPFLLEELLARVQNLFTNMRVRELLASEVESTRNNLEVLAKEVKTSLEEARVARDLAEQSKLVKDNFLRIMSHELRTPITSMQISLRRLLKHPSADVFDDRQERCLEDIEHASKRLAETIDTIMEYARIESGRLKLRLQTFSLDKLMHGIERDFVSHARQKGLELGMTVVGDNEMHSDPNIVRLVLVNLVGNAVKYTESGSVDVVIESSEGQHVMEVWDTGRGIADEDLVQIFEPFEQLSTPRHEKGVGSGLGLAIVRQMVEALHGRISVRSHLGGGSAFTVVLPDLDSDDSGKNPSQPPMLPAAEDAPGPGVAHDA